VPKDVGAAEETDGVFGFKAVVGGGEGGGADCAVLGVGGEGGGVYARCEFYDGGDAGEVGEWAVWMAAAWCWLRW